MSTFDITDDLFFNRTELDLPRLQSLVADSLKGADDGELYLEYRQSEGLAFDDGRLKSASFDTQQGFGLRSVSGESAGYAHASELSEEAIRRASQTVQAVHSGHDGTMALAPTGTNQALYGDDNPLSALAFDRKVKLLSEIDAFARALDPRVVQVSASLSGEWQAIQILRADGYRASDVRPLVRLNIAVTLKDGDKMESGSFGGGGRFLFDAVIDDQYWQDGVREALRRADVNLHAIAAPAGEANIVLGPGWPGVLLHEAVGHGLEGDFNRKKTSNFSDRIGEQVAAKGVTVLDDGTLYDRRGSLSIDDEGTPTQCTTLIEDGILVGYMQDRQNARLMNMKPTGNGRRQSYAHIPMPRMTNTIMASGDKDPDEILASLDNGIYAVNFGGGQVDITSGKFVFSCTEAYKVENGKLGQAIKGATLIGNGPDVMNKITMVGNDMQLDEGVGTCGKNGQGVPVGVGQPTLRIDGITVGGTA
ncbi:metalloprotease TldD [Kiloniella sp. b19]|uniref:metalloprotease TldD n=1 Tax=Kiloniella sp. GXU_MW_B19 TaxID=3141326 RepID=UPI0031E2D167